MTLWDALKASLALAGLLCVAAMQGVLVAVGRMRWR